MRQYQFLVALVALLVLVLVGQLCHQLRAQFTLTTVARVLAQPAPVAE